LKRPNIVFIMSDDHAAQAIGCYSSKINKTPNIDRIADEGMLFTNCFCTNSICAPSRAVILTGKHTHLNGVNTLRDDFDGRQQTFPKLLQQNGYQTAMIGKWHLGHGGYSDPTGFDYWNVLPGQGAYYNPEMINMGKKKVYSGYVTDIITDQSIGWIKNRDRDKPFCLMCHHKAPHRPWIPDEKHAHMYENIEIPEPETFNDDYKNRAYAAEAAYMRIDRDLRYNYDIKTEPPEGLSIEELKRWKYQCFIKDYLRCIASIDDNVGRLLDFLDEEGISEDTIVIYTSDQGFFLGEHGWFDKRFMYEESLRMPFVIRYPRVIAPGTKNHEIVVNLDFSPTFLDYAGVEVPVDIQGYSLKRLFEGVTPDWWRTSMYYRYWMFPSEHNVFAHYGVRTHRYKLIYYYSTQEEATEFSEYMPKEQEWELFDIKIDPFEMNNVYDEPAYAGVVKELKEELYRLKKEAKDFN
jgi:arylsulfatase A-like enzyme